MIRIRFTSPDFVLGIFAVTLIALATACLLTAGFYNAWASLLALFLIAGAFVGATIALTLLAIGATLSSRRLPWVGGMVIAIVALVTANHIGNVIARVLREAETHKAMAAGLEVDCRNVFAQYENDPRLAKGGYLFIPEQSSEFARLPASIRIFRPCYVTVENDPSGFLPANVGLCKNGFGGFAFGVRVFMNGGNIPETFWSKPLSPCVYIWQEGT